MFAGTRPVYYPNYQSYPARPASQYSQYPGQYAASQTPYGQTSRPYPGYQPQLMFAIKQQLGTTLINTSRERVTLQQLAGKQDSEPISATPYTNTSHTGVPTVDGALQRTGSLASYVPQAIKNVTTTSSKDALYTGAGASILTASVLGIGKLLGRFNTTSGMMVAGSSLAIGLIGLLVGGLVGFARSTFQSIRDFKDIAMGNRL